MSRRNRLFLAVGLAIALMLTATGAWAAPKFQAAGPIPGSVPPVPAILPLIPVTGDWPLEVNMGSSIFTSQPEVRIVKVELVANRAGTYATAPEGLTFYGDTFKITTDPANSAVQICYAYPPEFADKNAKINWLDETITPNVWAEIPDAVIKDGTICVTAAVGVVSLIGKP